MPICRFAAILASYILTHLKILDKCGKICYDINIPEHGVWEVT